MKSTVSASWVPVMLADPGMTVTPLSMIELSSLLDSVPATGMMRRRRRAIRNWTRSAGDQELMSDGLLPMAALGWHVMRTPAVGTAGRAGWNEVT